MRHAEKRGHRFVIFEGGCAAECDQRMPLFVRAMRRGETELKRWFNTVVRGEHFAVVQLELIGSRTVERELDETSVQLLFLFVELEIQKSYTEISDCMLCIVLDGQHHLQPVIGWFQRHLY